MTRRCLLFALAACGLAPIILFAQQQKIYPQMHCAMPPADSLDAILENDYMEMDKFFLRWTRGDRMNRRGFLRLARAAGDRFMLTRRRFLTGSGREPARVTARSLLLSKANPEDRPHRIPGRDACQFSETSAGKVPPRFARSWLMSKDKNILIESRWAEGKPERLPELAAELVRSRVDIIVTHGTPGTRAAKDATSTIPIVMGISGDAGTGLIASLCAPRAAISRDRTS